MTNKQTFEWINQQSHWTPEQDLYTVVKIKSDGEPESLMTEHLKVAFEYMNKHPHEVLYFVKLLAERK